MIAGEFDVVVVGAGNAGMCAALAARGQGARVLVLEAAPFDERGGRLGRGGGHYDRFLREARRHRGSIVAIAMAFELQIVADVPREAHDELVDGVVTETRVIGLTARRSEPSPSEE